MDAYRLPHNHCEIRWIDSRGNVTPDVNPSIGRVRLGAHTFVRDDGTSVAIDASLWFRICAKHAARLPMRNWEWER
jgi:hypothetical protein